MFEVAMNDQMFIATNQLPATTDGHCGRASCGNRDNTECVNLVNAANRNEDYLFIEGAFFPDGSGGANPGGIKYLMLCGSLTSKCFLIF